MRENNITSKAFHIKGEFDNEVVTVNLEIQNCSKAKEIEIIQHFETFLKNIKESLNK